VLWIFNDNQLNCPKLVHTS